MDDERTAEGELHRLRQLLVHDESMPPGVVARLQAAVRRDRADRGRIGWEPRIGIACLCFIVMGLSSPSMMSAPVAVVLTLSALLYPWVTIWGERVAPLAADHAPDRTTG